MFEHPKAEQKKKQTQSANPGVDPRQLMLQSQNAVRPAAAKGHGMGLDHTQVNPHSGTQGRQSADPTWFYANKVSATNRKSTQSPHGYVGRNDGRVQQSTAAGKVTASPKPTGAGVPVNIIKQDPPSTVSTPSTRNLTTNAKPSKGWSANVSSGLANRPHVNYAGQGQGKPAGGQKRGEKVSPTSNPR